MNAAAAADLSPTTSIQDVLNSALAAFELQKHFKKYIPKPKDGILFNNLYKSYAVKEYIMFLFLTAGDNKRHRGTWTAEKFIKAHADILNAIIEMSFFKEEITEKHFKCSYKNFYFNNNGISRKELTTFLEERLTAQQLYDFRLAFQNNKDDISGFLKYHLFKACNTNTDKFVNYFLQDMEFINAVIQKYKVKMSSNAAKDNVVCTLIIPTDCKSIDCCLLFLYNCICICNYNYIHSIHHLLVSCVVYSTANNYSILLYSTLLFLSIN